MFLSLGTCKGIGTLISLTTIPLQTKLHYLKRVQTKKESVCFGRCFLIMCKEGMYYSIVFINSNSKWRCSEDKWLHCFNNAFCSFERMTSSPSPKNWLNVIPNDLQIASSVEMLGTVSRWKILAIVDVGNPDSFTSRYSLQPRSVVSFLIFFVTSIIISIPERFCDGRRNSQNCVRCYNYLRALQRTKGSSRFFILLYRSM